MQLIVDIQDKSLANKIVKILEVFKNDGLKFKQLESNKYSDKYIEDNWREILLGTHSSDLDDDEMMYEAYGEFYSEKHSD